MLAACRTGRPSRTGRSRTCCGGSLGLRTGRRMTRLRWRGSTSCPCPTPDSSRHCSGSRPPGLEQLEPEAFRRGLHDSIGAWLDSLGERPVLGVEDVHWADPSTLGLLAELASGRRLTIVARAVRRRPDWLTDAVILEVHELGSEAIADLVDHVIGGAAAPQLHAMVADRSGGNPFFAEEIVRSLAESGALVETLRLVADAPRPRTRRTCRRRSKASCRPALTRSTHQARSPHWRSHRSSAVASISHSRGGHAATPPDVRPGALVGAGLLDPIDGDAGLPGLSPRTDRRRRLRPASAPPAPRAPLEARPRRPRRSMGAATRDRLAGAASLPRRGRSPGGRRPRARGRARGAAVRER